VSVRTGQRKWTTSAADYVRYAKEDEIESADADLRYHDRPKDGIVFDIVGGKALDFLPGLNRELGITKSQHADLHAGRWDGVQYLRKGAQKQWQVDDDGREVRVFNPGTGKRERVPVIDPETGKQRIEMVHTAGYDVTFTFSKDVDEYLVAHPEDIDEVRGALLAGARKGLEIGVEDHVRLVRVSVAKPSELPDRQTKTQGSATERQMADGIIYWISFGAAARPTKESIARGYTADPLTHIHAFVSSMAYKNGKWYTLDGSGLMKTADFRRDVADIEAALQLEALGFELEYLPVDRKGRIAWQIKGSRTQNREYLSTNSQRRHQLQKEYEDEHNRPMTQRQLDIAMQATKGPKSEAAKIADRGSAEQYGLVRDAMERDGLKLDMPKRGSAKVYEAEEVRIAELHRRLEGEEGLNRYCNDSSVFSPDDVLPATMRAGMGLGLTPERLRELAADYLEHHLEVAKPAEKVEDRKYTTKTIKANEEQIDKALDKLAAGFGPSLRREVVRAVIGRQKQALDAGQRQMVRAICSHKKLVVVLGPAGTGKGRALSVAAEALRETSDYNELAVGAVAAQRASRLAKELHADRGGSIRSLYRQWENGWRPTARTVIVIDEAAMANTFDAAKVMQIAGGKAKVVLVGDRSQTSAIGVSGWMNTELKKRPPIELTEVYRQPDKRDRDMLELIRTGRSELAISELHARNRIFVSETPQDMVATVAGRYAFYRDAGKSVTEVAIVHQGTNEELDAYNRAVQRYRAQHGEIDTSSSFVVSESSSGRRWTLNKGDRVTFLEPVFVGLQTPVRNGECGELLKVDASGRCRVRLDGPERRTIVVNLKPEMHRVTLGLEYCQSTARYQGNQVDVALATQGGAGITSRNSAYSQLSRMVNQVEVFVDQERWGEHPEWLMAQTWASEVSKETATEYMKQFPDEVEVEPEFDFDAELAKVRESLKIVDGHDFGLSL